MTRLIIVNEDESRKARAVMKRLIKLNEDEEIELEIRPFQVGDFITGKHFVERKKVSNLVSSILDKQIWRQADSLVNAAKELNMTPVILIEGSLTFILKSKHFKGFNVASAIGVYDSLQTDYGIQVVHSPNSYFTVLWLLRFAREPTERKAVHSLRTSGKSVWPMDLKARYFLEGAKGIGGVTSDRLLKKYGSLGEIFVRACSIACPKDLRMLQELLHYKYGSEQTNE